MSPLLEDELRATLVAHAADVTPDPSLAEAARGRAVRLRRRKRAQVAAGAVVIVGVAAIVPVLASLGSTDHAAPPVQPTPSVVPVPPSVLTQAGETHALLGMPTSIVDGTGPEVVTVPAASALVASHLGPENQLVAVTRARGGYVTRLLPSLFGTWTYDTAPPGVINFVARDGSTTLLGHPTPESIRPVVSPDGSLVTFEAAGASAGEKQLVVTDLGGHTLHQHAVTGDQDRLYLTAQGLWFACGFPACRDIKDRAPHYWRFADDTVTTPSFVQPSAWVAQAGDVVIAGEATGPPSITAYDVSDPASPVPLWTSPLPVGWASFDGSGTLLLVGDLAKEQAVLLDATTGKELDHLPTFSSLTSPIWTPHHQWLMYSLSEDSLTMNVSVVTPGSDGRLSSTSSSYQPYETRIGELPTFATIGFELPPPTP